MDELHQFFRDAMADQLTAITRLLEPTCAGDAAALDRTRRIAHSLKGSGASYGFPDVTEAAAVAERAEGEDLRPALEALCSTLKSVTTPAPRRLVLVIDDDPLIARLLDARLTSPSRRVATITSLAAARQFLSESTPDLIILDLFLPDGDGRSLLAEIRSAPETVDTPVVVVSAAESDEVRADLEASGVVGFIGKPFSPDEVVMLVSTALGRAPVVDDRSGLSDLAAAYRDIVADGGVAAVAGVIPETHGPGGRRADGCDPTVTPHVLHALTEALTADELVSEWSDGHLMVVSPHEPAALASRVDRARLRLRTQPHPTTEGALISLSAALVRDAGAGVDAACRHARRLATDANLQGGDRVSVEAEVRRAERVLLAEDDRMTAALIIHRLEREGFDIVHHLDGRSALESARRGEFGLVVLDVRMPGMDGFQVLERLRLIPSLDATPIVMVTAVDSERDVVRGFEMGANDYILKPFSPAELTARLKRFVRR